MTVVGAGPVGMCTAFGAGMREASARGEVAIHVPFQIREVSGNGNVERVRLFDSEDEAHEIEVEVEVVRLQLGFKTALGPLKALGARLTHGSTESSS